MGGASSARRLFRGGGISFNIVGLTCVSHIVFCIPFLWAIERSNPNINRVIFRNWPLKGRKKPPANAKGLSKGQKLYEGVNWRVVGEDVALGGVKTTNGSRKFQKRSLGYYLYQKPKVLNAKTHIRHFVSLTR